MAGELFQDYQGISFISFRLICLFISLLLLRFYLKEPEYLIRNKQLFMNSV